MQCVKITIALSFFIFVLYSCSIDNMNEETAINETIVAAPDSMVVAQLIQKSLETYNSKQNTDEAYDSFLKEAEELAINNHLKYQLFDIYNLVGKRLRNKSYYAKAMSFHQNALEIAEELEDPSLLAEIYNQMGTVYRRVDENSKALDMHMKSLTIAENNKDSFHISTAINGIGNVSFNLNRNLAAIEYFQRSLDLSRKMNNVLGMAINTNNIGDAYQRLNNQDSALFYHFESLDYNSKINSKVGQAICYNSIGRVYTAKKQYRLALEYLFKALEANTESGDVMNVAISYSNIGRTYLDDNYPDAAILYLNKALKNAQAIGSKYTAEEASNYLSQAYEKKGMINKALEYHKISSAYRDSTINEKNIFHMAMAEDNYLENTRKLKVEELSKQTLLQKNKIDRQKFHIITVIIVAVVIFIITLLFAFQIRLRNRYKTLKFQQRLLRSQMNPHFIFNALSAIQVFILENDMNKSSHFLSDFSKLMRQVLRSSNFEYISINEEIEILQYYLNLQQLRFSPPFEYDLFVDEELKKSNAMVPPMLIQPFIENAIEHGIRPIGNGGEIKIRFKRGGYGIIIEVEDNGIGIDYAKNINKTGKNHDSMAIKITQERLDIMRKDTRKKTVLVIYDKRSKGIESQGTVAHIEIPVITNKS
ncbi:tetratricopeptide repeat protein [Marinilabiliaceae bacterium A049]|nr:tetratricopeptide repeat protein [Marinilabiliaceae bacterium A049]